MKTGTDAVGLDHNPILTDTTAEAAMTPTEAIPGHTTGTADARTGVLPGAHAENACSHHPCHDTQHWRSSLHRSSSAYSRDCSRSQS